MTGTVQGGHWNTIFGKFGSVSGGDTNYVYGELASVNGGNMNSAYGYLSHTSGGYFNAVFGDYAVVQVSVLNDERRCHIVALCLHDGRLAVIMPPCRSGMWGALSCAPFRHAARYRATPRDGRLDLSPRGSLLSQCHFGRR
jgi:hypothetical protein